jgi:nitrite reductase (NADH) large subunit
LVVVSAGIAPNLALAKAAGIEVKRGILVSDQMETSVADIFAAGDIAEHHSRVYGLWTPAKSMGTVAGKAAVGKKATFPGDPPSAKLKVLGIDMFSIGQFAPSEPSDLLVAKANNGNYASFLFRGGLMIGAILLGDASWSLEVKQAVEEKRDFSADLVGTPSVEYIKKVLTGL